MRTKLVVLLLKKAMRLRNFEKAVNTLLIKVIIDEFTSRDIPRSGYRG